MDSNGSRPLERSFMIMQNSRDVPREQQAAKVTSVVMVPCLKNSSNFDTVPRPPSPPATSSNLVGGDVVLQTRVSVSSASTHGRQSHRDGDDNSGYDASDHTDESDGVDDDVDSGNIYCKEGKERSIDTDTLDPEETKEARRIFIVRILFSLLLISSTVGIACAVYFFIEAAEVREFENQYLSDADKLKESIGLALRSILSSADSWAINYIAVQNAGNTSFPFVALPNFAIQAAKFKMMARAYAIGVSFIVTDAQRRDWERFTAQEGPSFVEEAWKLQSQDDTFQGSLDQYPIIREELFTNFPELATVPDGSGPYLVWWQNYPIVYNSISAAYNFHLLSFPTFQKLYNATLTTKRPVLSGFNLVDPESDIGKVSVAYLENFVAESESASEPVTNLVYPILSQDLLDLSLEEETVESLDLVGTIAIGMFWRELLRDILPETSEGIQVVTEEICATKEPAIFTYEINGATTTYLGLGDLSDVAYNYLESSFSMVELMEGTTLSPGHRYTGIPLMETDCSIRMRIYPSSKTASSSYSSQSVAFTISSVLVFLFAGILFALYDLLVKKRQRKVAYIAARSSAIVADLFPKEVQTRLYEARDGLGKEKGKKHKNITWAVSPTSEKGSSSLDSVVSDERNADLSIADVYPSTTVMYAGIYGFARWSTNRDPKEVFDLLEALFGAFDEIANRQKIYKIENTGDTYVAACGVPRENIYHAVKMARFATDCRDRSVEILHNVNYASDIRTSKLFVRFGLASGPVAGGILRGQRARFQLFGLTTLNAELMERTGELGRIQATETTANLLCDAGKDTWVNKRPDAVVGGDDTPLDTFWVQAKSSDSISTLSVETSASKTFSLPVPKERIVTWFSDTLRDILTELQMSRQDSLTERALPSDETMLQLQRQIRSFVEAIGSLYSDLPFHNFENVFHGATTLSKILGQVTIEIPPVDRFSVMLAAMIREVDHPGIENDHLSKRGDAHPSGKSIIQLRAFELSLTILSDEKYDRLRSFLCPTAEDFSYFSQLIQSCVIATDVMNPIVSSARKRRWEQTFACPIQNEDLENPGKAERKKTKVVLEHLMIVAHLSYTMRSWNFYTDWSIRLYQEMVSSFIEGKIPSDPADSWFNREMMLFDNIVLPLLDTLRDAGPCKAIGAELMTRAMDNRDQWKTKGKGMVINMRFEFTGEKRVHFA
ncbi:adenylate/guanylate cyclase [Nitzschia inconspicua]|uniref:Adenylate/guanylate cyclase n=1 Tax=Nitzschia inconspicua TaxID=303405 RepID=A0A9K3LU53_9STRA|nr:adenylate/guanylate cyclase [Nitzschia inconspicua]